MGELYEALDLLNRQRRKTFTQFIYRLPQVVTVHNRVGQNPCSADNGPARNLARHGLDQLARHPIDLSVSLHVCHVCLPPLHRSPYLSSETSFGKPARYHGTVPKPALIAEFCILFLVLPLGYWLLPIQLPPLPVLWVATLYCYLVLKRDPHFEKKYFWNAQAGRGQLREVVAIFAVLASIIAFGVWWLAPGLLFGLVRTRPIVWAAMMVVYPIFSVYPQGLIYRAFLMHRYLRLLDRLSPATRKWLLVLISAAAFSLMHIIFRNWLSIWLTFGGGLLFAWRYQRTHSLAVSSFEHALYGCWLFTIGLGQSFYIGPDKLQ